MTRTPARFFLFLFFAIGLLGCDTNVMEDEEGMVTLRVQPTFDGQPLLMGQTYQHHGTAISFSTARVYLSGIALEAADGTVVEFEGDPVTVPAKATDDSDVTHTVTDRIILAKHDHDHDEWSLGHAPAGDYTSLRFNVGIAGLDNRVDATQVPSDHALAKQTDKNNHWNWSNGYIYVRLDGLVDSDGDGTPDEPFETHLGKENFLGQVHLSSDVTVMGGDMATQIHVMLDYHKLLGDVHLSDPLQRLCHTGDNLPVANAVAGQMGAAFMFHGVHESEEHGEHG